MKEIVQSDNKIKLIVIIVFQKPCYSYIKFSLVFFHLVAAPAVWLLLPVPQAEVIRKSNSPKASRCVYKSSKYSEEIFKNKSLPEKSTSNEDFIVTMKDLSNVKNNIFLASLGPHNVLKKMTTAKYTHK